MRGGRKGQRLWTVDEEELLYQGVLQYGEGTWSVIRDKWFCGRERSNVDIKDKWRNMKRKAPRMNVLQKKFGRIKHVK